MKKVLLPLALVAFVFAGTSCKKEYVCTCTVAGISASSAPVELNKKDAETAQANCEVVDYCKWEEA